MSREFTCIVCPRGCHITVDESQNVTGNFCNRGKEYVLNEISHPSRVLTTTIRVSNLNNVMVSVKTDRPVPKEKLFLLMSFINKLTVQAPCNVGQIVAKNPLGIDTNVVITKKITL